jgi:hypothetical protein
MNRIEVRMFSRLIRRLSCKQLQALLKKNGRRLSAALNTGALGRIIRAKLIRTLKAKRKMIKARIRVKCNTGTSTGFLGGNSVIAKLRACTAKAKQLYPTITSGSFWSRLRKNQIQGARRKAWIRKCMRATGTPGQGGFLGGIFGGFDGGYSNMPGPLGSGLPTPAVGITSPPNPIHTIPGQPYTSIGRPSGPPPGGWPTLPTNTSPALPEPRPISVKPPKGFISGWPNMPKPQRQVPYHTHNIYETPPVQGGYATTGPIANPYSVPRPVYGGRANPLRPGRQDQPIYDNYTGTGQGLAEGSTGRTLSPVPRVDHRTGLRPGTGQGPTIGPSGRTTDTNRRIGEEWSWPY